MGFFDRAWNLGKGLAKVHGTGTAEEREEARLRAAALEEELRRRPPAEPVERPVGRGVVQAGSADPREDRPAEDRPWEQPEARPPAKRTL